MHSFLDAGRRQHLLAKHPLPAVRDPHLQLATRSRSVRRPPSTRTRHNARFEALESFGDCVAGVAVGRAVLAHLGSEFSPALFSIYRNFLQSNACFAQLALAYNLGATLDPPLVLPFSSRDDMPHLTAKTLADSFEAHAGALWLEEREMEATAWLVGVFAEVCDWTSASLDKLAPSVAGHNASSSTPLAALAASRAAVLTPPPTPHECACWKRALSIAARHFAAHYEVVTETRSHARLVLNGRHVFEAVAGTKRHAEQAAAKAALFALDRPWAESTVHVCDKGEGARQTGGGKRRRTESSSSPSQR